MIPEFPNFKNCELSDKKDVEKFTCKFPPYSDVNFTNIWSWDTNKTMKVSQLNKNLIILFKDYVSDDYFLSFIGENSIIETTSELIEFSKKHYQTNFLKLIPEEIASLLPNSEFKVEPDRDSFDYIYSVKNLADMNNWHKNTHSKNIKKFIKLYHDYVVKEYSVNEIQKNEYIGMFKKWAKNKNVDNYFELNEYKAFERLFQIENKDIKVISLYLKDNLIGFSVYEKVTNEYAISHFAKADIEYHSSIYDILDWEEAKILNEKGIKYYNWELDLGISGLRDSKESYKPNFFLKKFIVSK